MKQFLILTLALLCSCSTQQLATSPIGVAVIAKVTNKVIDKGLNAGAVKLDAGNPYLHSLATGLRSVEGQVLTADDVNRIAADYGDPNDQHKFKTLALDVWKVIRDAAVQVGWAAATELAAKGIQDGATHPAETAP